MENLKVDLREGRNDQVICLRGNSDAGYIHFALQAQSEGLVRSLPLYIDLKPGRFLFVTPRGTGGSSPRATQPTKSKDQKCSSRTPTKLQTSSLMHVLYTLYLNLIVLISKLLIARAVEPGYQRTREHGENCLTLNAEVKPGRFVLSVLPQSKKFITIATILVP